MGGFTNKLLRWDVRNIVDCWICCNFKVSSTVYTVLQMQGNYHFAHERFFVGCYLAFESKLSTIINTNVNIAPHIFFFFQSLIFTQECQDRCIHVHMSYTFLYRMFLDQKKVKISNFEYLTNKIPVIYTRDIENPDHAWVCFVCQS